MKRLNRDTYSALGFIIFGIFLRIAIPITITGHDGFTRMGPRFFPEFVANLMIILGIIQAITSSSSKNSEKGKKFLKEDELRVLCFLITAVVTVVLLPKIGYILSGMLFCTVILLLFKDNKKLHYFVSYIFIGVMYLLFTKVIHVSLPTLQLFQ